MIIVITEVENDSYLIDISLKERPSSGSPSNRKTDSRSAEWPEPALQPRPAGPELDIPGSNPVMHPFFRTNLPVLIYRELFLCGTARCKPAVHDQPHRPRQLLLKRVCANRHVCFFFLG